ncbi:MAG TPA: hypothetical protein VHH72_10925 [Solirubrobacterales bacterium]|jgi:hypothetical protein|nr:hypothetical protein [Solirubrobacterales bacterium]
MPESTAPTAALGYTCNRCEMRISWMPDVQAPELPSTWSEEGDEIYCLNCRRERAGEAGVAEMPEDTPADERQRRRTHARIEFEIRRDPERPDNRIAKACRTSAMAVRKARNRIGVPRGPAPR